MTKPGIHRKLKVAFRIAIASVFIVLGLIITPLPIPLGLLMIAFGLILLAYDNNRMTRHIRILRRRFPGFSRKLEMLEKKNIAFVSDVLKKTNPAKAMLLKLEEAAETETDS